MTDTAYREFDKLPDVIRAVYQVWRVQASTETYTATRLDESMEGTQ